MSKAIKTGNKSPRRSKPTYVYSIISVSLVLFILGLLGLTVLHAHKLTEYFKENLEISIVIKNNVKEPDIYQLQKRLEGEPFVKSSKYVSKDAAQKKLMEELDDDFVEVLGYNPLYASINLNLNAAYANPDSMVWIENDINTFPQVQEVYYQRSLLQAINDNVEKISFVLIGITTILLIMTITLIDNTIRLAMYSNRFLIKSMQLVGAMRSFIIKPFISRSVLNGFISGVLAVGALVVLLYYAQQAMPELLLLVDLQIFAILFLIVVLIGIFISWISTSRAVRKYLRMRLDDLY